MTNHIANCGYAFAKDYRIHLVLSSSNCQKVTKCAVYPARRRANVFVEVESQLAEEPTLATRNRKLLRASLMAVWELRVGVLRVYYDVLDAPEPVVIIRAIGIKRRNRILIGGQEVKL